jgi:putative Mn2+ efflux pump MntP
MSIFELFLLAIGLSMDAFAVSICKGLSVKKLQLKHALIVGVYFGGFQALMPTIGYFAGSYFTDLISSYDHWVVFILLLLIGGNMVKESFSKEEDDVNDSFGFKTMLLLAIATSIDALAVGVSFAFLKVNILYAASFIGVITFVCSAIGIKIGNIFGSRYKSKAELAGGIILILIGTKVLLEHLGILVL